LAALHEETRFLLERGSYAQARALAERLLSSQPHFAPALNNLSQLHYLEGHLDQAVATAQQVLAFAPDNVHALANLARYFLLSGRAEEARACAERLKAARLDTPDRWIKQVEALSYLGDDQGVLDAFT